MAKVGDILVLNDKTYVAVKPGDVPKCALYASDACATVDCRNVMYKEVSAGQAGYREKIGDKVYELVECHELDCPECAFYNAPVCPQSCLENDTNLIYKEVQDDRIIQDKK